MRRRRSVPGWTRLPAGRRAAPRPGVRGRVPGGPLRPGPGRAGWPRGSGELGPGGTTVRPPARPRARLPGGRDRHRGTDRGGAAARAGARLGRVDGWRRRGRPGRGRGTSAAGHCNGQGRGILPRGHELLVTRARSAAFRHADLVVVAGTPLDFRLGYGAFGDQNDPQRKPAVVHVADAPGQLATHCALAGSYSGDLGAFFTALAGPAAWRPARPAPVGGFVAPPASGRGARRGGR